MPVTVKVGEKKKKKPEKNQPVIPAPKLGDFAAPDERSEGIKAFWLWFIPMLIVSVGLLAVPSTQQVGLVLFLWWLFSSIGYMFIAPRMILRRLRLHGDSMRISAKNQPRLNSLIAKGSSMLNIDEPEAFVLDEDFTNIRVLRGGTTFILVSKATVSMLQVTELDCLVIRALVQEKQKQVRRMMLLQLLAYTHPAARFLAWPVALYGNLLRAFWSDLADQTADRLTLLIMKNENLLMGAMLKQFAATDPLMIENKVTTEDIDTFIKQAGVIDTSGSTISNQYKIGSSISANPFIKDRVDALRSWANSQEYQDALQKLAEERAKSMPAAGVKAQ